MTLRMNFVWAIAFLIAATSVASATVHIVAFGDSSTEGVLVPPKDRYPTQLEEALRARGHDVQVHNAGVAGDTTARALLRFARAILPATNIAIVELGINDLRRGVPTEVIDRNIATIIRALQARGILVLVVGILELDLSAISELNRVPYVQFSPPPGQHRASDGEHFNGEGYALLVERLLPAVEALIARAKQAKQR